MIFQLLVVVVSQLCLVNALFQNYRGKTVETSYTFGAVDTSNVTEAYVQQSLDWFNAQDARKYAQRYFVDETYWSKNADAPVFLCVGGEGPALDKTVLVASSHCNDMVELGAKRGALHLAIEHRYYGPSMPFPGNFSTANLQWLSTEQALEDIASFHTQISEKYGLTKSNKWVTWGGSYPGMLAALSRLRYPQLIHASVSSSSPLEAAIDFPGYQDVVAESIANPAVGGSDSCLSTVVEGHKQIGEKLATAAGRRELESTFNICSANSLEDADNRASFAGDGVVYFPVQGNDPSCTSSFCNIASICSFVTASAAKGTAAMQTLADLNKAMSAGCTSVSYSSYIKVMASDKNTGRSWPYQTCTEWGFYQTCEEGSSCPFTQGLHNVEMDLRMCEAVFGLTPAQVQASISATNPRYGGRDIRATRIMYPNGDVDPWKAGGVLKTPSGVDPEDAPVLLVAGASHHFWTHPSLATDSSEVVAARQAIWAQVDKWLAEA